MKFTSNQSSSEIINGIKSVKQSDGVSDGVWSALKGLERVDQHRTELLASTKVYGGPSNTGRYLATTDGEIVDCLNMTVTNLDDSFWDHLDLLRSNMREAVC